MSTRRTLICAIAGALLAAGRAGRAQTPGKVYRIGWLSSGPWAGTQPLEVFNQGMRELGWVEGRHYMIDNRYTEGRSERIAARLPVRGELDERARAPRDRRRPGPSCTRTWQAPRGRLPRVAFYGLRA